MGPAFILELMAERFYMSGGTNIANQLVNNAAVNIKRDIDEMTMWTYRRGQATLAQPGRHQ